MLVRTLLTVATTALLASPADAQIYAWRDAKGTLVLSDRKLDADARTFAVPDAPGIRATRPVVPGSARSRFEPIIMEHAARHSLRPELVRAVIQVESGFNPRARSPKGAMGLMQLMPETARDLGVLDAYDPADNIRSGTMYLRRLIDRYQGNEELALAAYNAGSGAVDRYGRAVPPFRETRDYVKKVGSASGGSSASRAAAITGKNVIYKTVEVVDGRPIPRYSTQPPPSGAYEVLSRQARTGRAPVAVLELGFCSQGIFPGERERNGLSRKQSSRKGIQHCGQENQVRPEGEPSECQAPGTEPADALQASYCAEGDSSLPRRQRSG